MKERQLRSRIWPSLQAALAGWAAAMLATFPIEIPKIVSNSDGGPGVLLMSLVEGAVVWGLWGLAFSAGGWLFGLVPVILLVPENWLLRHRSATPALAAIAGWLVVLVKFKVWELVLPYHSIGVRIFILYSLLFAILGAVSAAVYLRLLSLQRRD